MIELLTILAPIALVDSLSVVPLAMVPLVLLLGGSRPVAGSLSFLAGILATYLPFGVLLLFGLDALFDRMATHFSAWWNQQPDLGDVLLEILIGLVMIVFGHRLCSRRGNPARKQEKKGMTPSQAFLLAALINLSGMWGALPYFAAITQILKVDLSPGGMLSALLFYNLVFLLPLASFLVLHLALGDRATRLFNSLNDFVTRWGSRVLVTALIGLGFVLVVDGIGWLFGAPLFAL